MSRDATSGVGSVPDPLQTIVPLDPEESPDGASLEALVSADAEADAEQGSSDLDDTLLPIQMLDEQIQRTDSALLKWRDESVRRRSEWEEEEALAELEAAQRLGRTRVVVGMVAVVTCMFVAVGLTVWRASQIDTVPPVVATATATPAVAPAEIVAPEAERDDPARVAAATPETVAPEAIRSAGSDEPQVEADAAPAAAEADATAYSGAISVVAGSVQHANEGGHRWTEVVVASTEPVYMQWLDASGNSALNSWPCGRLGDDGTRHCRVGRSNGRIGQALAAGATPGTWTVEICGAAGCTRLHTLEVAAPR